MMDEQHPDPIEVATLYLRCKLDLVLKKHSPDSRSMLIEVEKWEYELLNNSDLEALEGFGVSWSGRSPNGSIPSLIRKELLELRDQGLSLVLLSGAATTSRKVVFHALRATL